MGFFKEKKKKKNATQGKYEKIEVGGEKLPVLSFYLFTQKDDGKRYIELTAAEELEALHFSEVEMVIYLSTKKLIINGIFEKAFAQGKFKVYKFEVAKLNEYYI